MGHDYEARVQWEPHFVVMVDRRNMLQTCYKKVNYNAGKNELMDKV